MMKKVDIERKVGISVVRFILVCYSLIVAFPLIWTIYSSLKTSREFLLNPFSLPETLQWVNYSNAIIKANMGVYALNSVVLTIIGTVGCLFISFTSAYAITRYKNAYTSFLRAVYMAAFMVPAIISLPPLFRIMKALALFDSRLGLQLLYCMFGIPFTVFILSGFLSSFSREYEEAAFIDGCSKYGILFRIVMPISRSALITSAVFVLLGIWNEYIYALTFIVTDAKKTIPIGLQALLVRQKYHTDWGALFAGIVLVLVPTLGFYVIMQKQITSGITAGGLKM